MESLFSLLVVVLTLQGFVWKADAAIAVTSAATASIAEDASPGDTVMDLTASGAVAAITWTIQSVADTNLVSWFAISGSKVVVATGQTLDRESTHLTGAFTVTVNVRADDQTSQDDQALVVTITNVDEAPAFSALGSGTYMAGPIAASSAVVTFLATDPENAAVTHAITAGAGGKVEIASATGAITTKAGQTLTNCYLALTVTASDATSNVATAGITVCVGKCTDNCDGSSGASVPGSILALLVAAVLAALKL